MDHDALHAYDPAQHGKLCCQTNGTNDHIEEFRYYSVLKVDLISLHIHITMCLASKTHQPTTWHHELAVLGFEPFSLHICLSQIASGLGMLAPISLTAVAKMDVWACV